MGRHQWSSPLCGGVYLSDSLFIIFDSLLFFLRLDPLIQAHIYWAKSTTVAENLLVWNHYLRILHDLTPDSTDVGIVAYVVGSRHRTDWINVQAVHFVRSRRDLRVRPWASWNFDWKNLVLRVLNFLGQRERIICWRFLKTCSRCFLLKHLIGRLTCKIINGLQIIFSYYLRLFKQSRGHRNFTLIDIRLCKML